MVAFKMRFWNVVAPRRRFLMGAVGTTLVVRFFAGFTTADYAGADDCGLFCIWSRLVDDPGLFQGPFQDQ